MIPGIDLTPYLTSYLELRRALGIKLDSTGPLQDFVQFINDRKITGPVTTSLVFDWLEAGNSRSAALRGGSVR